MGMVIIGLFCMVFYSVLIIRSLFQTERFRGSLGEAEGGGRDGGSRRLSAISSSVEQEGIPRLLQPDLSWGAPGYHVHGTTSYLLTGGGLEMKR